LGYLFEVLGQNVRVETTPAAANPNPVLRPAALSLLVPFYRGNDERQSLPPYGRCPGLLRSLRRRRALPGTRTPLSSLPCCAKPCTQTLYSDLIYLQVYTCIMLTSFDCLAKKKRYVGCTCVHPCPLLGPPLSLNVAGKGRPSCYDYESVP
jgi:hypothetical protein